MMVNERTVGTRICGGSRVLISSFGARVIDRLSEALTEEFGRGYLRETLKNCRRFYLEYKDRISQTLFTFFAIGKSQTLFTQFKENPPFTLPWSHYLILMRIKDVGRN
ncbi:MAG: DUF1016 N-terminal domain-containing protein [Lachnospiraceae bacterium]|nr:DUF1016 N-terminal domain-containing protein [Lachnospiraceae bacterium]